MYTSKKEREFNKLFMGEINSMLTKRYIDYFNEAYDEKGELISFEDYYRDKMDMLTRHYELMFGTKLEVQK